MLSKLAHGLRWLPAQPASVPSSLLRACRFAHGSRPSPALTADARDEQQSTDSSLRCGCWQDPRRDRWFRLLLVAPAGLCYIRSSPWQRNKFGRTVSRRTVSGTLTMAVKQTLFGRLPLRGKAGPDPGLWLWRLESSGKAAISRCGVPVARNILPVCFDFRFQA